VVATYCSGMWALMTGEYAHNPHKTLRADEAKQLHLQMAL